MSKIQQIADTLSVSVSTVSRALKNNPRISQATREKVWQEAQKIGYRPDHQLSLAMRTLRSGSSMIHHHIALWWPGDLPMEGKHFENPEIDQMMRVIAQVCEQMRVACHFKHTHNLPENTNALMRVLRTRGVSGLLLGVGNTAYIPYTIPQAFFSLPLVSVRGTPLNGAETIVDSDYSSAYRQVFEQARRRNYKRPGIIVRIDREHYYESRYIGSYLYYTSYLKSFEKVPMLEPQSLDNTDLARRLEKWINRYKPDLIVSPYHHVLWVLENMLGMKVPQDIAYVGTNYTFAEERITAPQIDVEKIAYESVLALINQIEGKRISFASEKVIRIRPVWVERETMPSRIQANAGEHSLG